MPESAVRTFTDPDAYFGGIRNLSIDGLVTGRGSSVPRRRLSTCTDCTWAALTKTCLGS